METIKDIAVGAAVLSVAGGIIFGVAWYFGPGAVQALIFGLVAACVCGLVGSLIRD